MYINDNPTQPNFTFTVFRKLQKNLVRMVSPMKPLIKTQGCGLQERNGLGTILCFNSNATETQSIITQ